MAAETVNSHGKDIRGSQKEIVLVVESTVGSLQIYVMLAKRIATYKKTVGINQIFLEKRYMDRIYKILNLIPLTQQI